MFGADVVGLAPGQAFAFPADSPGYPRAALGDVPSGKYWLQVQLRRYDSYARANETLLLPTSCVSNSGNDGEYGWPAGTIYGEPVEVDVGGGWVSVCARRCVGRERECVLLRCFV